ncbi:MAG: DUF2752 domain-containing protein, partial [Lachnospiraceae bacterium]|nr:DUF2752 domain-containing protein [Lachnospiraceae bacterium]
MIHWKKIWRMIIFVIPLLYMLAGKYFNIWCPCIINKYLHLDCVTCGITRLFIELCQGHIYQAFRYNVFIFACIPVIPVILLNFIGIIEFKGRFLNYYIKTVIAIG